VTISCQARLRNRFGEDLLTAKNDLRFYNAVRVLVPSLHFAIRYLRFVLTKIVKHPDTAMVLGGSPKARLRLYDYRKMGQRSSYSLNAFLSCDHANSHSCRINMCSG